MSGNILVFQDSNYVCEYRTLCTVSPPPPQSPKRFCCRAGGSSKCLLLSVASTNHQQRNGEFDKLQIYSKKIKSHQPMELPVFLSSGSVLLFPGLREEEEDPFWWVLSVQLG